MSTFVLIHGGWHAAWCWLRVVELLERQGHQAIAPDLHGHGKDLTPFSKHPSEMYVPKVCGIVNDLKDRAILVGHSSGGMIISEASRLASERIKSLVYLTAFLLPSGKTPRDVMGMDSESVLRSCLEIDLARGVSIVRPECARKVFYGDCSDADCQWAISQLQPEPLIPPTQSISSSETGDHGPLTSTPRFYIECLRDRALGPQTQRWMYTESPCAAVYSLPTSHSPFLSAPEALTECLLEIAERSA